VPRCARAWFAPFVIFFFLIIKHALSYDTHTHNECTYNIIIIIGIQCITIIIIIIIIYPPHDGDDDRRRRRRRVFDCLIKKMNSPIVTTKRRGGKKLHRTNNEQTWTGDETTTTTTVHESVLLRYNIIIIITTITYIGIIILLCGVNGSNYDFLAVVRAKVFVYPPLITAYRFIRCLSLGHCVCRRRRVPDIYKYTYIYIYYNTYA